MKNTDFKPPSLLEKLNFLAKIFNIIDEKMLKILELGFFVGFSRK